MAKYRVTVSCASTYVIEADNAQEAIQVADGYFAECIPEAKVEKVNKEKHCKFCEYAGDLEEDCWDCDCFHPIDPDDDEGEISV